MLFTRFCWLRTSPDVAQGNVPTMCWSNDYFSRLNIDYSDSSQVLRGFSGSFAGFLMVPVVNAQSGVNKWHVDFRLINITTKE